MWCYVRFVRMHLFKGPAPWHEAPHRFCWCNGHPLGFQSWLATRSVLRHRGTRLSETCWISWTRNISQSGLTQPSICHLKREREMRAIKITSILQDVTCTTNREHPRTLFICLSFPVYNYAILLMPLRLKEVAGQKWVRLGLEIRCRKCQRNSSRCMYQSHNGQRAFKQSFGDAKIWHMNMTLIWHMISLFWHTSFEYVWAETGWGWSPFRQSRWQRCCQDEQGLNSHIWVWHGMAWYGMVWHSGVGGSTLQYCACDACDILWRLWRRRSWKSCLMRPGHCSWHSSKTRLERWWLEKLAKEL